MDTTLFTFDHPFPRDLPEICSPPHSDAVHTDIQELNERIATVAKVLNTKGHWAGLKKKRFLYTCCDIGILKQLNVCHRSYLTEFYFPPNT